MVGKVILLLIHIQIFDEELEYLSEYNGFNDWLHAFALYRGKKSSEDDDDDHRIVGKFKVSFLILYDCRFFMPFSNNQELSLLHSGALKFSHALSPATCICFILLLICCKYLLCCGWLK